MLLRDAPAFADPETVDYYGDDVDGAPEVEDTPHVVRVVWEGQEMSRTGRDSENIAAAHYDSTVDLYRRTDPIEGGVTVQMTEIATGDVRAEAFIHDAGVLALPDVCDSSARPVRPTRARVPRPRTRGRPRRARCA